MRAAVALGVAVFLWPAPAAGASASRDVLPVDDTTTSYTRSYEPIPPRGTLDFLGDPLCVMCIFAPYGYESCLHGGGTGDIAVRHDVAVSRSAQVGHYRRFEIGWEATPESPYAVLFQLWKPPDDHNDPVLLAQDSSEDGARLSLLDLENGRFVLCAHFRKTRDTGAPAYELTVSQANR